MDHAAGVLDLAGLVGGKGFGDGVRAGKLAGQGRVQVDNSVGEVAQNSALRICIQPASTTQSGLGAQLRGQVGIVLLGDCGRHPYRA
ncbi:MAG: hypothetical protein U0X20_28930 [Caldilineaceae bacterium]